MNSFFERKQEYFDMIYQNPEVIQSILSDKKNKNNPKIRVLLSSEVGSEGLDMQFCSSMVNYDLPWNPMVVEQRIGRIDRFGQKSPIVNISNIIVRNSIQEEIYARLLDRIGIFRNSIGDLESILDRDLEKEGYQYSNINQMLEATEREFRFDGMYMNIIPIISLFDLK